MAEPRFPGVHRTPQSLDLQNAAAAADSDGETTPSTGAAAAGASSSRSAAATGADRWQSAQSYGQFHAARKNIYTAESAPPSHPAYVAVPHAIGRRQPAPGSVGTADRDHAPPARAHAPTAQHPQPVRQPPAHAATVADLERRLGVLEALVARYIQAPAGAAGAAATNAPTAGWIEAAVVDQRFAYGKASRTHLCFWKIVKAAGAEGVSAENILRMMGKTVDARGRAAVTEASTVCNREVNALILTKGVGFRRIYRLNPDIDQAKHPYPKAAGRLGWP